MDVSRINFNEMKDCKNATYKNVAEVLRKKKDKQFAQLICSYLSLNVILNYYRKCISISKKKRNATKSDCNIDGCGYYIKRSSQGK